MIDDLLKGGTSTWVLIGLVVFFLLRGGAGGGAIDGIIELLRSLLNRPKPESGPNLNNSHECVNCVIDLAKHLEKQGHAGPAKTLRDLLPDLVKDHRDQ